jgi:antitoxin HigA-1
MRDTPLMIKTFADKRTKDLYDTGRAKRFPPDVAGRAARKLEYVELAIRINGLKVPPGNRSHALEVPVKASTRYPSTTSGVSVSGSSTGTPTTSRSVTTPETRCEMSIANTGPIKRRPPHPGEMLREDFLPDCGLTVSGLASANGVSRQSVNELLRGRRAVSPEMALRLGKLFGNSPKFWLNAQRAVDLWDAAQATKDNVARIKTLSVA